MEMFFASFIRSIFQSNRNSKWKLIINYQRKLEAIYLVMKYKGLKDILTAWVDLVDIKDLFLKQSKEGELNFLIANKDTYVPL